MRISIVTTIYKAEKDLPRLLDSMMALRNPDLEFFLIDNGSPDRCGEICAEYARKDSRFFVLTLKENIGYIRARMLGLKECHGDYVGFCDSDDYLEPNGYDHAAQLISEQNCDLYITAHMVHMGGGELLMKPPYKTGLYQDESINQTILPQAFGFLKNRDRLHGYMWKQVVRKDLVLNAGISLIENLKPWEDQVFNIDVIKRCQRVYIDDHVIYHYFANTGSVTASMIKNFDAHDFWQKTRSLYQEKIRRASKPIERRATANSALFNIDLLVVSLCRKHITASHEVKNTLSALFNGDEVWHQICSESNNEDLSKRLLIVKYCLKAKLYRPLFYIVKHKLRG